MDARALLVSSRSGIEFPLETTIGAMAEYMSANKIDYAYVVDDDKKLVGEVSSASLARLIASNRLNKDAPASRAMANALAVSVDKDVNNLFGLMTKHERNCLAIVDRDNTYLGYATIDDVTRHMQSRERIYLGTNVEPDDNLIRHIARYEFARSFVGDDCLVLDCACGSGYGTELLAEKARQVTGVDLSSHAIEHATIYHSKSNVSFVCGDIADLQFADESLDNIVSLETLEHLPRNETKGLLRKANNWLKVGGVLIASSPMLRYVGGLPFVSNPFHVNEMDKADLLAMLRELLPNFLLHYYAQQQDRFLPLLDENTGFAVLVARKKSAL